MAPGYGISYATGYVTTYATNYVNHLIINSNNYINYIACLDTGYGTRGSEIMYDVRIID